MNAGYLIAAFLNEFMQSLDCRLLFAVRADVEDLSHSSIVPLLDFDFGTRSFLRD